jgi:alpha-glucosidase
MKSTAILFSIFFLLFLSGCTSFKRTELLSPDENIKLLVIINPVKDKPAEVTFSVYAGGKTVLLPSSLKINSPDLIFDKINVTGVKKEFHKGTWIDNFGARKEVPDNYNEAIVFINGESYKARLICRVYNEGVAFAYEFPEQEGLDSITITDEKIQFRFPADYSAWSAPMAQAEYRKSLLSKIDKGCERPLVIEYDSTLTVALAEAKLIDYARMKFEPDSNEVVTIRSRLGSEVHKKIPFQSPWRVIMIGKNPGDLLEKNYLLANLNDPSEIKDVSWIKPGKVLREVTLTTAGAKAAIDFTSLHNMQYIEFDAGWYGPENNDRSDPTKPVLDPARSKGPLDLKKIIDYANSKNIRVLLYVNRKALERQLDSILPLFKEWGIAGIKFGFVQVGTQPVTAWMHDAIRKAAGYQMVVDVHDEYRPTGWSRTYPNFLTMEGIRGDEESPANHHTLITMFTRMVAGQGDNTICYYNDRVQNKMGSHASQLAKAVCLFSPLQFIYWYDKASPTLDKNDGLWGTTNYIGDEPELEFFDNVPTTWDETKVLFGKIGEYGVIARRKGADWFIGGINAEQERTLNINFSFLEPAVKYRVSIYSDDPTVDTRTHVKIEKIDVERNSVYSAKLGSNNGIAMHIIPVK